MRRVACRGGSNSQLKKSCLVNTPLFSVTHSFCSMACARASLLLMAYSLTSSTLAFEEAEFTIQVRPLIRCYIFKHYAAFAESELTFRSLKNAIKGPLGMTYDELKGDAVSNVIETITDQIANECNMGEVAMADCKRRIGHDDSVCDGIDNQAQGKDEA